MKKIGLLLLFFSFIFLNAVPLQDSEFLQENLPRIKALEHEILKANIERTDYSTWYVNPYSYNLMAYMIAMDMQYTVHNQFEWNTETSSWDTLSVTTYQYDEGQLVSSVLQMHYMNMVICVTYNYTCQDGKLTEVNATRTMMDTEVDYLRETLTYDGDKWTGGTRQEYDGENWIDSERWTLTWNGDQYTELLVEEWDTDRSWTSDSRTTYTWTGGYVTCVTEEEWYMDAWQPDEDETFVYAGGYISESTERMHNGIEWVNDHYLTYVWTDGHPTSTLRQDWDDTQWVDAERTTYTYNQPDQAAEVLMEAWIDGSWVNAGKWEYFYGTGNNSNIIKPAVNNISADIYPNPFNPSTTVAFNLPASQNVYLDIFNAKGQKVTTLHKGMLNKGEHKFTWNGKDHNQNPVGSGIYLYRLSAGNQTVVKKALLLK